MVLEGNSLGSIGRYVVPSWLIIVVFTSGIISGIVAYRLLTNVNIDLDVKEPIEILDYYPSQFSLYPGETAEFNITLLNRASLNYSVVLDFQLNDTNYQNHYVTFSNEIYTVIPGQQNLTGWLLVKPEAPPGSKKLTVSVERGGRQTALPEDFMTYAAIDPNSHIMRTTNHVDFRAFRDEDAYVYNDKGTDYFGSNWLVKIDVKLGNHFDNGWGNFFALANAIDDWEGILTSGAYELCAYAYYNTHQSARSYQIGINEGYNGIDNEIYDHYTAYNVQINTWYYCTIERSGLILSMKIYSDSARTNLLQTLTLTLHSGHVSHRYVYAAQSVNRGDDYYMDIDIENLIIP
jgi:hypothetical protein